MVSTHYPAVSLMTETALDWPLFGDRSRLFVRSLAGLFPVVSGIIWEARLSGCERLPVDLSFRLLREYHEFPLLEYVVQQLDTHAAGRLRDLAAHCLYDAELDELNVIWLEFDECVCTTSMPDPGIFFGAGKPVDDPYSINKFALDNLWPDRPPQLDHKIRLCLQLLPPGGYWHFTGLFLSRRDHPLRFTVSLPLSDIGSFLVACGASALSPEMTKLLADIAPFTNMLMIVNFNLTYEGTTCSGIEVKASDNAGWSHLLKVLALRGIVSEIEANLWVSWEAYHPLLAVPANCSHVSIGATTCDGGTPVYIRRISHIKLQQDSRRQIQAKIYLFEGYGAVRMS